MRLNKLGYGLFGAIGIMGMSLILGSPAWANPNLHSTHTASSYMPSSSYVHTSTPYTSQVYSSGGTFVQSSNIVPLPGKGGVSHGEVTSMTIPGLGSNEKLCKTDCPVNVYNPEGGTVIDCFEVCEPVKAQVQTEVQTQTTMNYIRVIRPVFYVRPNVNVSSCGPASRYPVGPGC